MLPMKCNTDIHYHTAHTQHNIHPNRTRHEYTKKCLRDDLPKVINGIPAAILDTINTHCLKGFANYIKCCIFQSYQETCTIVNCYIYYRNELFQNSKLPPILSKLSFFTNYLLDLIRMIHECGCIQTANVI